jgi:hypothetical protein
MSRGPYVNIDAVDDAANTLVDALVRWGPYVFGWIAGWLLLWRLRPLPHDPPRADRSPW